MADRFVGRAHLRDAFQVVKTCVTHQSRAEPRKRRRRYGPLHKRLPFAVRAGRSALVSWKRSVIGGLVAGAILAAARDLSMTAARSPPPLAGSAVPALLSAEPWRPIHPSAAARQRPQRLTFSDDGNSITGRWEIAGDGANYTTDLTSSLPG